MCNLISFELEYSSKGRQPLFCALTADALGARVQITVFRLHSEGLLQRRLQVANLNDEVMLGQSRDVLETEMTAHPSARAACAAAACRSLAATL